jgi:HEPN domain-containing protein
MAIINLYSKRKLALQIAENDVYSYDPIPSTIRSQLKQMFLEGVRNLDVGRYDDVFKLSHNAIEEIVFALRREYGIDKLSTRGVNKLEELLNFVEDCETDRFLDCVELFVLNVLSEYELSARRKQSYVCEINHRFKESGLGYEVIDAKVVRIDSQILHVEILKPTLLALSKQAWLSGAEQEIQRAFANFRSNDNKGAVVEALKAFESVMKAILTKRAWSFNSGDPSSRLIAACFEHGLVPDYLQSHFSSLKSLLQSGVPAVRNKSAAHGQGSTVADLPDHFASYVLYTALANMKLLLDCDRALG